MIDIHTHILPYLDDGPTNWDASLEIVKNAEKMGITKIICTPHFIKGNYDNYYSKIIPIFEKFKELVKNEKINVELYAGCEIYFDTDILDSLLKKDLMPLNNGKYILIEFPMVSVPKGAIEIFYKLQLKGYYPILAHPERNQEIINNFDIIKEFTKRNVFVQTNSGSLLGYYGNKIKDIAIEMIREKQVTFIASDIHNTEKKLFDFSKCISIISKYIEMEKAVTYITENPLKIIKSEEIEEEEIEIERKGKLSQFIKNILGGSNNDKKGYF
ncbi:MAG TPA: hypothetical protein PLD27_00480 [bacterium]|nr:hypothetical protein [bacterium]HOL47224.1 hypothetical protein [bacterium]HPQ18267.1 hypothetical protein [bacterium]